VPHVLPNRTSDDDIVRRVLPNRTSGDDIVPRVLPNCTDGDDIAPPVMLNRASGAVKHRVAPASRSTALLCHAILRPLRGLRMTGFEDSDGRDGSATTRYFDRSG
jgi:hypothetical protein